MRLNGVIFDPGQATKLGEILELAGYKPDRVAVLVNEEIIQRHLLVDTEIGPDDVIEVVHFMGGGSR
ncbi:MAG: sulfur carrier protein ThiS [Deltaproteobacteria bacterium]|jgi:thiamine biosynthesis protein ThiS|nr:sulfur carrier protein ThiS [Deltaproteobacteria bacterium]